MLRFGAKQTSNRVAFILLTLLFVFSFQLSTRAALQFDVFAGYGTYVREGDWFPMTVEVNNDGPPFRAMIEIRSPGAGGGKGRLIPVDLPTGTLKRISVPVFCGGAYGNWIVNLVDEKGKLIVGKELDYQGLRNRSSETIIMGAICRTSSGMPAFPDIKVNRAEVQPVVARWQTSIFPDSPISLSGMGVLYLSSERALDLKDAQIEALIAWLQGGGHLILGVDQVGDVNGTPWLRGLVGAEMSETRQVPTGGAFLDWLRERAHGALEEDEQVPGSGGQKTAKTTSNSSKNLGALFKAAGTNLVADPTFESASIQVSVAKVKNGRVLASSGGVPLAFQMPIERGKLTVLTFSAERQPFVTWKNKDWLWTLLAEVPPEFYEKSDFSQYGFSADSIFGAMIESTQVRKVPLLGLVALLLVYLVIIGPVDQIVLRRARKQMLTWVTFPCYVLLFSVLIYFIGFKLRAGESEYSELHIVDVFPNEDKAILRGRTYSSIYSPANERYRMKGEQFMAAFRGEYLANWGSGSEQTQATVSYSGNRFDAEVYVPVWTSQLYVNDWWQPVSAAPMVLTAKGPFQFTIQNNLDRPLTHLRMCIDGKILDIEDVPAGASKEVDVQNKSGISVADFARGERGRFMEAAQSRRQTFGNEDSRIKWDLQRDVAAACFVSYMNDDANYQRFVASGDLDLTRFANQDSIILLAWDANSTLIPAMNQFKTVRGARNSFLRVVAPRRQTALSRAN